MTISVQLPKLIIDYGADSIKTALVQHWAKRSDVRLSAFKSTSVTQRVFDRANSKEVSLLLNQFGVLFPKITLKDVEKSFELTLDKESRKLLGTVYTPEYIIDYLVKNSLNFAWKNREKLPKICDPSCGSGGFLLRIAELLEVEFGISGEKAFSELIVGIDIDKQALEQAKCLIELYLLSKKQHIPNLDNSLLQLDTLMTDTEKILSSASVRNGFDVIVTNPPYVKFQNLSEEYRQLLISKYDGLANGNFSLSVLFLIKGFDMLTSNGSLGVITQNNLFTSLAGKNVREYLQQQQCIRRVVDFGHQKVFDNASTYTCLIFLGKENSLEFEYARINNDTELNLSSLNDLAFSSISLSGLKANKWRLGTYTELENLKKIETMGKPLIEVANIKVGFATLKDSVFFVRDGGSFCVANVPNGNSVQIEREITRSAVKVSELKNVRDLWENNRRIIFPYFYRKGIYKLIPEQELQRDFPDAHSYLLASREILETRDKGKKKYENWYAWARTQGMEAPAPKLLTKTFSKFPQFFLDKSDQLFCNGYSITPRPATLFYPSVPIEFLEKVLNSKIMYYYAKLTSFQIEGGYQCYQKNFIERFGIPDLELATIDEILSMSQDDADRRLAKLYGISFDEILEVIEK